MVIALLFLALAMTAFVMVVVSSRQAYQREEAERKLRALERSRMEGCREVVLFFANQLGYIARSVISKHELSNLIDQGYAPDELASEIAERIDAAPGLILGYQPLGKARLDVKLAQEHRERHIYIIGKSGSGKTNLMRSLIMQDLEEGNGIGVIAPEAEMIAEELLPFIPDHRIQDVIYCNPADDHPVSFNPLHLDHGEDLDAKVDENLTIFQRIIGASGPRMEEILRQALYALVGRPGATLLDVERLLDRHNPAFRNEVIASSVDPAVSHFWAEVYPIFPKDAHLPIVNRLGKFLRPKTVRNILCNPHKSLDFRQCMDEGRIMLFNLSDGILGEQNSQLLGQLVVAKFQLAVMSRANVPKEERRNFYLYLDEFQTFTGTSATSYEKMLSRARKYKLGLVLAHQQTGQLPGDLLREIMGNVSTAICFLVSREDAMKFSKELVTQYNGEVIHIPEEEILRLKVGQCWCKIGQHSFLMHTYLVNGQPSIARASYIAGQARENFAAMMPIEQQSPFDLLPSQQPPLIPEKQEREAKQNATAANQHAPKAQVLQDLDPSDPFGE